jgi:hypothetical protein
MTTFARSPRVLNGGIVLVDPATGAVQRIVALQYNPATFQRTLTAKTVGEEADRSQALRLYGPPQETYTLEAEIDAADQLEKPDENEAVAQHGIALHVAATRVSDAVRQLAPTAPIPADPDIRQGRLTP